LKNAVKEILLAEVAAMEIESLDSFENLKQDLIAGYQNNTLFSHVQEDRKIQTVAALDSAEAFEGESDEDFARRLQEAEIRLSLKY
jgi:hypothetical protein